MKVHKLLLVVITSFLTSQALSMEGVLEGEKGPEMHRRQWASLPSVEAVLQYAKCSEKDFYNYKYLSSEVGVEKIETYINKLTSRNSINSYPFHKQFPSCPWNLSLIAYYVSCSH